MNIHTRFGIGEEVIFMYDNKPRCSMVVKITVIMDSTHRVYIKYELRDVGMTYAENDLCNTLEELKEKVFGNGR